MPKDGDNPFIGEEDLTNNPNNSLDPEVDFLDVLVGEGKKYATAADLAKAYAHVDSHAQTVIGEKAELEVELNGLKSNAKTMDDILAAIGSRKPSEESDPLHLEEKPSTVSEENVLALVAAALDKRDKEKEVNKEVNYINSNQDKSWEMLSKVYGDKDKAKAAVANYVGDDKLKLNLINNLAGTDPQGLLSMIQAIVVPTGGAVDFGLGDLGGAITLQGEEKPNPAGLVTHLMAEVLRKSPDKKDQMKFKSRQYQALMHKSCAENPNYWKGVNRKK